MGAAPAVVAHAAPVVAHAAPVAHHAAHVSTVHHATHGVAHHGAAHHQSAVQWLTQLLTTLPLPHTMSTSLLPAPLTTPRPGAWRMPSTPPTRLNMPCSTTTRASRQSTRTCWPTLRTAWTG